MQLIWIIKWNMLIRYRFHHYAEIIQSCATKALLEYARIFYQFLDNREIGESFESATRPLVRGIWICARVRTVNSRQFNKERKYLVIISYFELSLPATPPPVSPPIFFLSSPHTTRQWPLRCMFWSVTAVESQYVIPAFPLALSMRIIYFTNYALLCCYYIHSCMLSYLTIYLFMCVGIFW